MSHKDELEAHKGFEVQREGDKVTVKVEVPPEAVRQEEKALLGALAHRLHVPGFRPGKAPAHLVLSRYGEQSFLADLKESLVREWLAKALAEADLRPATTPEVHTEEFHRGGRLAFRAEFEVLPQVEVPDELPLQLPEPPPAEVDEEELESVLEELRKRAGVLQPKDGPVEAGDVVRIRRGEQVWEVEVDPQRPLASQLMGAASGQPVTLQDEDDHTDVFEVAEIYRLIVPDEQETAGHYGDPSWEAMRERVRATMLKRAEAERLTALRIAALDTLADHLDLQPPAGLVAEITGEEMQRLGLKPAARSELEAAVRRRLRRDIIAQRVAEQQGLLPTDEELESVAAGSEENKDRLRSRLVFQRAADWILEHARRKE
ncbi:MAG: trigger factor [Candidatus Bipolaricaulaceae bacterium]